MPPAECVPQTAQLATSDGWEIVSAADDPFDDRPVDAMCIPQAVSVEGPALEIDTGGCPYVTLRQVTRTEATSCDVIRATLVHSSLIADDPGEAHAVFRVGGTTLFDERIPIPAPTAIHELVHEVDTTIPAGTPILVHVHNHGANDWFVTDVRLGD